MEFRRDSRDQGEAAARTGAGGRLLGLLQKLARTGSPGDSAAPDSTLAPAGKRSGAGTDSLVPYLNQGRASRPAPLE